MFWGPDGFYGMGALQGDVLGGVGGLVGGALGGEPGAVRGAYLAQTGFSGALDTHPVDPPVIPPQRMVSGQVVQMVGELNEQGEVMAPPVRLNEAEVGAALGPLLGPLLDMIHQFDDPDYLASNPPVVETTPDGRPLTYSDFPTVRVTYDAQGNRYVEVWNTKDPLGYDWVPLQNDYAAEPPAEINFEPDRLTASVPSTKALTPQPTAPPLVQQLARMYGAYEIPTPTEPASIFDPEIAGSSGSSPGPQPSANIGAPLASATPSPARQAGAVGAGGAPSGVPYAPSPGQADDGDWTSARQIFSGFVEGVPQLAEGFVKQVGKNALYGIPTVGQVLFAYDVYQAAQKHGGGLGAYFIAANEMFNPVYGGATAAVGAYDAAMAGDDRGVGNKLFQVAVAVVATAGLLEGAAEAGAAEGGLKEVGEGAPRRTKPTGRKGGTPEGNPAKVPAQGGRGIQRENASAKTLAKGGYRVKQNEISTVKWKKNPDFTIEGETFDNYAPSTDSARNIAGVLKGKIGENQAQRFILNLDDCPVTIEDIQQEFLDHPIRGLKEVIAVKDGQIIPIFP